MQRCVPDLAIQIVSQNDQFEAPMKKVPRCPRWETQEFLFDLIPGFSIRIADLLDRIGSLQ